MRNYYRQVLAAIEDSLLSIDETQYERLICECVGTLKKGGKIIASGLGKNVPICEKFVGTMNSLGMDARFLHTNSAVHGDLGIVRKEDLVLLLSKSGNTEESVMLAGYLRARGTDLWLLSFNEAGRLAAITQNRLLMRLKDEGDAWNIVPNNSTSVYLILLQGIAMEVAGRLHISLDDFKKNHPGGGIGAKLRGETA